MAQRLTGVSRSLSRRMPPHRADRRGKSARRGRRTGSPTPIQQARPFPYRLVSAIDFSGQMTFCRRKVRLRVICPAEGRFSGENRLPAQIRPESGFGGQIHANKKFVRQHRPFPYRHGLRDGSAKLRFPVPNEADARDGHAAKRRLPTAPPHPDAPRATPRPQLS